MAIVLLQKWLGENGFKTMITEKNIFKTSEAAFAVDRNGQIVAWNQAAEQTFGYTESEALEKRCWNLLSGRDVFGNQSCCRGCPVRATAFDSEPISRFQIGFKTAMHGRKRFNVSTMMLFYLPEREVLIHICFPVSELSENPVIQNRTNNSTINDEYKALTSRQTEVLALLNKGMTVAKIAVALGITASTVHNHTQHIFLKLHVHSRFEAVALGRRLDLI